MTLINEGTNLPPGITALDESTPSDLYWSQFRQVQYQGRVIDGTTRDAGNTSTTTLLRSGLLMGQVTSTKKLKEWDPIATDGTETIAGVLFIDVNTQRMNANQDRFFGWLMVGGPVKVEKLIIPGNASRGISGDALERLVLTQMLSRFQFNELETEPYSEFGSFRNVIAKTADFVVLESQNGTLFTNKGDADAINFTLPTTAKKGLHYGFFAVADFILKVTGGTADTLVVFNDAAADSIAFATASEIVGSMFEVYGDGALWLVKTSLAADSVTVTIVT